MKAIQTKYDGYHFRSRLEARWAVFFNKLNIKYEYEKEGFELPSGRYLPDFYLTDYKCWIEIKGVIPKTKEIDLLFELSIATNQNVFMCVGLPGENRSFDVEEWCIFISPIGIIKYDHSPILNGHYNDLSWHQCPCCKKFGLSKYTSFPDPCSMMSETCKCCDQGYGSLFSIDVPNYFIKEAVKKSKESRFEFGESPAV